MKKICPACGSELEVLLVFDHYARYSVSPQGATLMSDNTYWLLPSHAEIQCKTDRKHRWTLPTPVLASDVNWDNFHERHGEWDEYLRKRVYSSKEGNR